MSVHRRKTDASGASVITPLARILGILRRLYRKPEALSATDPFEQILFENAAYLADDARREEVFRALKRETGLNPARILSTPRARLHQIARRASILPAATVEKLRQIATIALEDFGGDLDEALRREPREAIRALKKFPSIGNPGADKILLFSRILPVLALDSNALRVLLRLGFGKEDRNYAKSYSAAQEAASRQLPKACGILIEAHQLLRRHGQELCKRTHPCCEACPLRPDCVYFKGKPAALPGRSIRNRVPGSSAASSG